MPLKTHATNLIGAQNGQVVSTNTCADIVEEGTQVLSAGRNIAVDLTVSYQHNHINKTQTLVMPDSQKKTSLPTPVQADLLNNYLEVYSEEQ